ncbi:unnamed protein product [Vitrella brassicaformis CCMP3155]|uniref:Uncharacterized protein n=1 Tax=Vitrella brassicaformis (strain CCMP3155) TaxID=1169540 RepID=A0A0G4ECJ3_VITBC|nr:unnamed protein product [Vitrella brassicaformis CCMP3155]|eukprot:CEL93020.1 unnamed protein product [Vitrella brassicaformis CCMP3155]
MRSLLIFAMLVALSVAQPLVGLLALAAAQEVPRAGVPARRLQNGSPDCLADPEHPDCAAETVDCAATPEHPDCAAETVDCAATPEHPDCRPPPEPTTPEPTTPEPTTPEPTTPEPTTTPEPETTTKEVTPTTPLVDDTPTPTPDATTPAETTPEATTTPAPPTTTKKPPRDKFPDDGDRDKCCFHCHLFDHDCWKYECSFSACHRRDKRDGREKTTPAPAPTPKPDGKCCWECHLFDHYCWKRDCSWASCDHVWAHEHPDMQAAAEQKLQACARLTGDRSLRQGNSLARVECTALERNILAAQQVY